MSKATWHGPMNLRWSYNYGSIGNRSKLCVTLGMYIVLQIAQWSFVPSVFMPCYIGLDWR